MDARILIDWPEFRVLQFIKREIASRDAVLLLTKDPVNIRWFVNRIVLDHRSDEEEVIGVQQEGLPQGYRSRFKGKPFDLLAQILQGRRCGLNGGIIHLSIRDIALKEGIGPIEEGRFLCGNRQRDKQEKGYQESDHEKNLVRERNDRVEPCGVFVSEWDKNRLNTMNRTGPRPVHPGKSPTFAGSFTPKIWIMAQVELVMPKMGESIMEATVLRWLKQPGDTVDVDETVLEIATDKVDSEVPSPVAGVISEILFKENDVVPVGKAIAIIATEGEGPADVTASPAVAEPSENGNGSTQPAAPASPAKAPAATPAPRSAPQPVPAGDIPRVSTGNRFYSPLVRTIAQKEQISLEELEQIPGSGQGGRVTKHDILDYVANRGVAPAAAPPAPAEPTTTSVSPPTSVPPAEPAAVSAPSPSITGNVEIIEMDRMRKLIADHMVMSKQTSPHVTSFVEVDVTNMVNWRNKVKKSYQEKYGDKITFTPLFVEAVVKAIRDFPMINISVEGGTIIRKKDLNIGMATALPSGNLIVPVIKNADFLNLAGLTRAVNDLAGRARENKLKPEEIQGGTFTLTNVGTFGNVMGTPIINQPQVAIMATGAIRKKPAVVETAYGDMIAIRQMMFLSLSYDHRVVDGFLGGSFLRKVGDYLEAFDPNREF